MRHVPAKNPATNSETIGSFSTLGLSDKALAAVDDLGYVEPTPVQAQAIPAIADGRDVMAAAQTGTGKTAAFLLPSLDRLPKSSPGCGPRMLVVTPTRELAQQIETCARTICARTGHSCAVVVGGVGYEPQRTALAKGCDLLVATPGRLIDLMGEGVCDLSQVDILVLDEADRMLDMGFLPSMRRIVAATPKDRQTLLFSATLSAEVLDNTKNLVKKPVRVEIAPKGTAAETVEQYVLGVDARAKVSTLVDVLNQEGSSRVIAFSRGKHRADAICRKLKRADISCAPIHGNRSQSQRENALKRFSTGEVDVLVATDVLARGIDIAGVSYVVNVDVPSDPEDYIHRIGRTGRAGEYGWALTFVSEDEYLDLRDIEQLMGKVIPDFPRATGIEVGDEPFPCDPNRDPKEKLPGKKERKRLQAEREARREQRSGKSDPSRTTSDTPHGKITARPSRPATDEHATGTKSDGAGTRTRRPNAAGNTPTSKRATAKDNPNSNREKEQSPTRQRRRHRDGQVSNASSPTRDARAAAPRAANSRTSSDLTASSRQHTTQQQPRPRRRPGDKGGQRAL